MTVYEFMKQMGEYEEFYITCSGVDLTCGTPTSIHEIKMNYEERNQVLDSLEKQVDTVDMRKMIIYCEV